jgi:hypothetical protein
MVLTLCHKLHVDPEERGACGPGRASLPHNHVTSLGTYVKFQKAVDMLTPSSPTPLAWP